MVFIELVYLYLVPYLHFMSVHGSGLDRDAMLKCYYISDSIFKPCTGAVLVLLCTCFGFTDEYIYMYQTVSSRPDELFQISGLNYLYQVSHTSSVVGLIRQFPMFCPLVLRAWPAV